MKRVLRLLYTKIAARSAQGQSLGDVDSARNRFSGGQALGGHVPDTRRRLTDAKQTFYAVQWWFALSNAEVRLSHESLKGYGRQRHTRTFDPVLWESTMVAACTRLTHESIAASPWERAAAASAHLLASDCFARAGDIVVRQPIDVRSLQRSQRGAGQRWTMFFFPQATSTSQAEQTTWTSPRWSG